MNQTTNIFLAGASTVLTIALSVQPAPPRYERILVIGNSITLSSPSTTLEWPGYWGMAASQSDKDWVHRVQLEIAARQGIVPEIGIVRADIHSWQTATKMVLFQNVTIEQFDPDLVVVQMGDNSNEQMPVEQWTTAYQEIASLTPNARHLALGVWAPNVPWKEERVRSAALATGMEYSKIHDLHVFGVTDARHYTAPSVGWHPGDLGMQRIAERVVETLYASPVYLPGVTNGWAGGTIPGTIPPGQ